MLQGSASAKSAAFDTGAAATADEPPDSTDRPKHPTLADSAVQLVSTHLQECADGCVKLKRAEVERIHVGVHDLEVEILTFPKVVPDEGLVEALRLCQERRNLLGAPADHVLRLRQQ